MKKMILSIAFIFIAGMAAWAQTPNLMNYQGVARSTSGTPLASTNISLRLSIHDGSATATTVYQETQSVTTNTFGLYNVSIGSGTVISGTFSGIDWSTGNKWMQVEIDPTGGSSYTSLGASELLSVPYALYAANSPSGGGGSVTSVTAGAGLSGGTITTAGTISMPNVGTPGTYGSATEVPVITTDAEGRVTSVTNTAITGGGGGGITSTGTANYIPEFTSATAVGNSAIYQSGTRIGVGTTAPISTVGITSATDSITTSIYSADPIQSQFGVLRVENDGSATSTASGGSPTAISGWELNNVASNTTTGVNGFGTSEGMFGEGYSASTSAAFIAGVEGDGYGSAGQVNGLAGNASNNTGTTPDYCIGVIGNATGGLVNYSGYFVGDVYVGGTLSKAGGTFKIDDPIDPSNKYLVHSFVESPDMMNIYNGNITTDAAGVATVTLPDYFEALNKDFRYQLTTIGSFAQTMISREISGNTFEIKTNAPNVKVSWQVTGVRKDAWANAHRVVPEIAKEPFNKGKYLDAKDLNKPQTQQITVQATKSGNNSVAAKSAQQQIAK